MKYKSASSVAATDGASLRRCKRKSTYNTCAIEKEKKEEINRRIKLRIWSRMQNANRHGTANRV